MKNRIIGGILSAAMFFSSAAVMPVIGSAEEPAAEGVEAKIFSAASYNAEGKDQTKPDSPASNAADGDDATVWSVFSGTVSAELILDLGESKRVNTIRLLDKGANITDYDYT